MVFPFTVAEIVLMGRLPHRPRTLFESRGDVELAHEAMIQTDTVEFARKSFNELSGGERQRVVLASALAQNPEVLLLDEPTSALDQSSVRGVEELVLGIIRERRVACVIVTHNREQALRLSDRTMVMEAGRMVRIGATREVLHDV